MIPRTFTTRALLLAATAALLVGPAATQNPQTGPVARYDMRAGTTSGFMAMAGGGMGGALSMMMGGGGGHIRELELRLGSQQLPTKGKAKADHFMPAGAKLGKSVPLFTPEPGKPAPDEDKPPEEREFKKPKGRLLIYWGCGAKAPKGQPVVIDFAKMAAGQVPPNLFASTVIRDYGPQMSNSKTYGYWPGADNKRLKGDSSLIGAHRIAGNYSPEIAFTLAQDFLDPLKAKAVDGTAGVPVSWNSVPRSTGYFLWAFGAKGSGPDDATDLVWWSSSASRDFFGGLTDWISPAEVTRLINRKAVLPPAITQCTIPAEVRRDAPDFLMGNLFAYGPEENFAYPPKPADAKARWDLIWTARVRHRSTTSFLVGGPDMGQMGSADKPEDKPKCKKGLGGLLGGALGAC
ncbi:MAG: hypothetical protein SFV20_10680 [Sphingopyxis sp.]|nr:hypothetical protein [Sphingopyxis sp.]